MTAGAVACWPEEGEGFPGLQKSRSRALSKDKQALLSFLPPTRRSRAPARLDWRNSRVNSLCRSLKEKQAGGWCEVFIHGGVILRRRRPW